jgi:bifunctional enzyme CysN/CysC
MLNAARRGTDVHWQAMTVDRASRRALAGHEAVVVWLTGVPGAGKSTLADLLERRLHARGLHTYVLDGDNVRHGLNRDLGFTPADRAENVRRVAEVAKLMVDAGLIVIAALVSPFRAGRQAARALMAPGEFIEVHVDAPDAVAERRDPKGLYEKARDGRLPDFTGVDAPYEAPEAPELRIDTSTTSAEEAVEQVLRLLRARKIV